MSEVLVPRMRGFGTTIFAEMSALALETGSDQPRARVSRTPTARSRASCEAAALTRCATGYNQYPPGPGIPALRQAIRTHAD